tara:strand:+ start:459 stop:701 length:243 start_codon:yes stop_codon:yes gene_type:complete
VYYVCDKHLLPNIKIKENEGVIMLVKMIADELLSDKTKDEIIDEINKAVDIPIISEKTEKAILEALWKIIKGVLLKRLGV